MRTLLTLVLLAGCMDSEAQPRMAGAARPVARAEDAASGPADPPPVPTSIPERVPEFCGFLWDGLLTRDGFVYAPPRYYAMSADEARLEPDAEPLTSSISLAEADAVLRDQTPYMEAVGYSGTIEPLREEQAAYHRVRATTDARARFADLLRTGGSAARLLALCGIAELAPETFARALEGVRARDFVVEIQSGCLGFPAPLNEIFGDAALQRVYPTPLGLVVANRDDHHHSPNVRVVRSFEPLDAPDELPYDGTSTRRFDAAIASEAFIAAIGPFECDECTTRADVLIDGDALQVRLYADRPAREWRFTIDAATGEAADLRRE